MITRRTANLGLVSSVAVAAAGGNSRAQTAAAIDLPPAQKQGGKPLMEALTLRRSTRSFDRRALPRQVLGDLLWAAYGVNRPSGDRTAPCWRHIIAIDVYACMQDGVWRYDPAAHRLVRHLAEDIRAATGTQDFVATAPLNLVYVAEGSRMGDLAREDRRLYASVDASFIGQNVYLYCAGEGLATVFRAAIDYDRLNRAMRLGAGGFVTFAQTVGYPA